MIKKKSTNSRGFSLIELLGVLVIIGLVLLIVIPATSRLLFSNTNKSYDNYLLIIREGAEFYANNMRDDLGSNSQEGCIEVMIEDLIDGEYIKAFNDSKVTCSGRVRINNDRGRMEFTTNITCVNDDGEETFVKSEINTTSCLAYVPRDDDGLKNKLIANGIGSEGSFLKPTATADTYIRGSNPNNYVWYSGKMWRIVSYQDDYVKMITDDIITVLPRNTSSVLDYENSTIDNFLTSVFLPTLKDSNQYLVDATWDVSPTSLPSQKPSGTTTISRKVALLNNYDARYMGGYLENTYKWITSNYKTGTSNVRVADSGGSTQDVLFSSNSYYAIRPAVTVSPDVFVISGNGSESYPYILEGNSTNIPNNTLLNTRYSGEYVTINGNSYRIIRMEDGLTQVIMTNTLLSQSYSTIHYRYSLSDIYQFLNNDWYENSLGDDKDLVFINGAWCDDSVYFASGYSDSCNNSYTTAKVGLPRLGDIFTANSQENTRSFWTLSPYNTTGSPSNYSINIINANIKAVSLINTTNYIRPVMYLKNNVIITGGSGTKTSPFQLALK